MHHNIELFHQPTLMHKFLYSLTICLLHFYPRHVSSINMPILRRKNCILTASGIFALCKRQHSTLVESGLQSSLNQCTVQTCNNDIEDRVFRKKFRRTKCRILCDTYVCVDGFRGLMVSILATGTRVRGFKNGRSRWIFRVSGKSSVCLPSEGK